ncbi:flagellar protein FlaG [Brevibacillus sp. AY1]|uniref:flagellar protein FlaG n=1 Tax=Brevibacillus sp. AY1 TaxID=2807621 RepID=UPI002456378E|nr:flagellar protein FlaG [Brevibacillus sp. AY1]MDH4618272.1 flagellar protein FlaG [Brevibacillus sp. AY1]
MDVGAIQNYGKTKPYTEFGQTSSQSQSKREVAVKDPQLDKRSIEQEITGINKWLQSTSSHIKFTLHEDLNEYFVQVIDDQTNEVIREIPSKKVMDMVAKMHEMIGLLVDEKR